MERPNVLKRTISRFRSLPIGTRRLLSLGIIVALVLALPVLVLTIITSRNYYFNRAATGETNEPPYPTPTSTPVTQPRPPYQGGILNWDTGFVKLSAYDFYIAIDGNKFFTANISPSALVLRSDPPSGGDPNYTTLEAEWHENGVPMRLYMYFTRDMSTNKWRVFEIRTYDGSSNGNWLYFPGLMWLNNGTPYFSGDMLYQSIDRRAVIHFSNLYIAPTFWDPQNPLPSIKPIPIPKYNFKVKFAGINDGDAEGAKITIRFKSPAKYFDYITSPAVLTHIGNGVYQVSIYMAISNPPLPISNDYQIYIKGEKHLSRKFCRTSGQSSICTGNGTINIGSNPEYSFDFTGLPLEPGDLPPQDGVANSIDFKKIVDLFSKPCGDLTAGDKLTADLDYSSCVNVRDAFLMRKTLETRYDEN